MTVREIIISHLRSIGADGLCSYDCGCGFDDLMPCAGDSILGDCSQCVPARKSTAKRGDPNIDWGEYEEGDEIYEEMK